MDSNTNDFRSLKDNIVKYYEFDISDISKITPKTFHISTNEKELFVKITNPLSLNKYEYLYSQGVNNIIYPLYNKENSFVTKISDESFYISEYHPTLKIRSDTKVVNLYNELNNIHKSTSIKKTLDPFKSRMKFDELSNQLDYKFRSLEQMVRIVESKPLNQYSMSILENYYLILNAKKELIKLQKRIISSIKAKESVNYSFLHNNPDLEHIINVRGSNYLVSLDNGKLGIESLDMAKFYIMNEKYDIDFKNLIKDLYYNEQTLFYYDYFRFIVLVLYIKRIPLSKEEFINSSSFLETARCIKKYFENFSNYEEQTSNP